MSFESTIDKKQCLDWLIKDYKQKPIMDDEYKNYERVCANKDNVDDILNLHNYFNDNNLIRVIYKQMAKDYGFCFLRSIDILGDPNPDDISISDFGIGVRGRTKKFSREKYMPEIENCKNKIFAIPFSGFGHANMLIVNTLDKTFEHFEPHGPMYQGDDAVKISMQFEAGAKALKDILFPDGSYTYYPSYEICPMVGFQRELNTRFESSKFSGSCQIWSMWYAFLRLSNPDKSKEEIYDYAVNNTDLDHIDDFIIYLTNAFVSKTNIERDNEGIPISADGKGIRVQGEDKTIQYANGNIYVGKLVNGIPNGFGKMVNTKYKLSYEGIFINGAIDRNSINRINLPSGDVYLGEIKNGVSPSGRGRMTYLDKTIKEGIWNNGVLETEMPIDLDGGKRKRKIKKRTLKKRKLTKRTAKKRKLNKRTTRSFSH